MSTPDQKRQAAAIFTAASEGKVIEHCDAFRKWQAVDVFQHSASYVSNYSHLFRIAPDPIAPGHNPAGLTVSQVGEGCRLLSFEFLSSHVVKPEERKHFEFYATHSATGWLNLCHQSHYTYGHPNAEVSFDKSMTWRTLLSVEALAALDKPAWRLPDPPAGKRWHREGEWKEKYLPVGYRPFLLGEKTQDGDERYDGEDEWSVWHLGSSTIDSEFQALFRTTRPLPVFNPRDLPGFRPLLPSEQPHRLDFTEADLPEGYRPLLLMEHRQKGDQYWDSISSAWLECMTCFNPARDNHNKLRTRRPLPTTPRTRPWSKPEDVPGPVCWLRYDGRPEIHQIIGIQPSGVKARYDWNWGDLKQMEYSLDRKTWFPCQTEEK